MAMSAPWSATAIPRKFTGRERDAESGLNDFGARYYSSSHGRFLSPDEFVGGPVVVFSHGSSGGFFRYGMAKRVTARPRPGQC